jgi:hypothetical protein
LRFRIRSTPVYITQLRTDLEGLITNAALGTTRTSFLHHRWLLELLVMERKAQSARKKYYFLRGTTIVGGVVVPTLVGIAPSVAVLVSLLVAVTAAIDGLFHYGQQWQHFRLTAELLKSEGWQFFQRTGHYSQITEEQSFGDFADRIEGIMQQEVHKFMTELIREKPSNQHLSQQQASATPAETV